MVRLVPIEKAIIGEYASHEGDLDYFLCDLAWYRAILTVHWYQWYDWNIEMHILA